MTTAALNPMPHIVVFGRDVAGKPHASWFDQTSAELATKAAALMGMHAVPVDNDALRELVGTLPKGRVFSSGRAFTPFVAGKLYTRLVELTREVLGLADGETEKTEAAAPARPAKGRPKLQVVKPEGEGDGAGNDDKAPAEANPTAVPEIPAVPEAPAVPVAPVAQAAPPAPAAAPKGAARPNRVEDIGMGSLVLATTGPMEGWWEAEVIGLNGNMLTLRWRDFAEPTVVRRRTDLAFLPAIGG